MPAPSDADYSIILTVQGAPYAVVTATGVEVKFNVRFTAQGIKNETVTGLSAISIDTSSPKDQTSLPSIVLKRFAAGDTMWLLAKRYCSAEELIRAANGLEGDAVPQIGEMVIIPKKR
jgi:LysM repeat protein